MIIKINCCELNSAVDATIFHLKLNKPNYICVTDVGNLVNANRKFPALKNAINNSFLSLPDGRPISIFARVRGIKNIERVAGPDFMKEIFERTSNSDIRHFFIGDTEEILNKLKKKICEHYHLQIAGCFSPRFENWDTETDKKIIERINNSNADIIWISLGGGKQEIWMKNNFNRLNKGIMIGIGAAFRFYLGEIKRAPLIFQKLGFEWFFRLVQEPKKMFKRYATTLPFFIIYSSQEILKINSNKNKY